MENKFSFAAVGIFVVGFSIVLLMLIVWLTVGTEKIDYLPYKVKTTESVSGLSINSTVDYKGVNIGIVKDIKLNIQDPRYVIISLDIMEGTPIKKDTEAILVSRGVTGLVGVSLRGGTESSPNIVPTDENPVPNIKNGASLAKRLDTAFNDITKSLSDLSEKVDIVVTKENADKINNILTNVETITANFAGSSQDLALVVKDVSKLVHDVGPKFDRALDSFESLSGITNNIKELSDSLKVTLDSADKTVEAWSATAVEWQNFGRSIRTQVPNINSAFTELNNILYQTSQLINELNNHPNALIMGKQKAKAGPGE